MVRHAIVPINTLKPHHQHHPHHHHTHAAAAATQSGSGTTAHTINLGSGTAATTGHTSFGEHRRIPSFPGGRTAAAFLTNLSANLQIPDSESPFPSPISTPPSMRGSAELYPSHLAPPSPLAAAVLTADMDPTDVDAADAVLSLGPHTTTSHEDENSPGDDPLADIPPLDTYVAESETDKVAALKLVADSIAQQRQSASWAVISNPSVVAVWVLALAVAAHFLYRDLSDWPIMLTTGAGVTMAALVCVRMFTSKYIALAEGINWTFLDESDCVVVSRWGSTIIGAAVVSLVGGQGNRGQRRRKRGVIKAWTVGLKWRGKGIGMALLEEACRVVGGKGGDGIEFAEEHANAVRVLHPYFNRPFDVRDQRAEEALRAAVRETGGFGKKRRSY